MNTLITQRLDDAAEVIEALREATDDIALISSVIIDRIATAAQLWRQAMADLLRKQCILRRTYRSLP